MRPLDLPEHELAYWRLHPYSRDDVRRVYDLSAADARLALIEADESGRVSATMKFTGAGNFLECVTSFFRDVFAQHGTAPFSLVASLHDSYYGGASDVPVFAFAKNCDDFKTVLIPDPEFIANRGYAHTWEKAEKLLSECPWERKIPTLFWRGSTSGLPLIHETLRDNQRIRLALLSQQIDDSSLVDAYVTWLVQCLDPSVEEEIRALGIVRPVVPFDHFFAYRYLLDIDGNACSWGLFPKLCLGSLVFKVQSRFKQWYYDELKPWQHFIPIHPSLDDLAELARWAQVHDAACRKIADASRAHIQTIGYDAAAQLTATVITQLRSH